MSKQQGEVREVSAQYSVALAEAGDVPVGYKRTEVGVIPEDWKVASIGELVVKLETGTSVNSTSSQPDNCDSAKSILKTSSVFRGIFYPNESKEISPEDVGRARCNPRKDSLIISRMNTPDLVGEVGYVKKDYPNIFLPDRLWLTRPGNKESSTQWLGYILSFQPFKMRLREAATGTSGSMKNLSKETFLAIALPFPTLQEQHAIATSLSDVDALIAALDKLIAKKRAIKAAAMQQFLTGKQRLPDFTGEWEVKRLGDSASFLRNGTNSRAELHTEGVVKYLHYGDIHTTSKVVLAPDKANMPFLPEIKARSLDRLCSGDLVFADASEDIDGVGKSVEIQMNASVPTVAGLHTIAVRFDKSILADGFKAYLQFHPGFREHLRRLAVGAKVFALTKTHIASAELALPPVEEQTAIAQTLSDMDAEITALEKRRAKTRAIKQGMMQELLTGRTRLV